MTVTAKKFNEQYGLTNISDKSFKKVDIEKIDSNTTLAGKPTTNLKDFFKRFFSNKVYVFALIVFIAIIAITIIAPLVSKYTANKPVVDYGIISAGDQQWLPNTGSMIEKALSVDDADKLRNSGIHLIKVGESGLTGEIIYKYSPWEIINKLSNTTHSSILGTEAHGYDIWTTVWSGTGYSLLIAIAVAIITVTIGTLIGSWIGLYVGSMIDIIFIKILSVYNSIPRVVWYALIAAMLPPGIFSLFILFILTGWMSGLGTARMFMWKYVNSEFMLSAQSLGVSKFKRIIRHALPNYLGIVFYGMVSAIPGIIEGEASLAFLEFTPSPNIASLGNILSEAEKHAEYVIYLIFPTLIIFFITMSLHFVAMGVNDALEPRFKNG